jgi:hypothetical protein
MRKLLAGLTVLILSILLSSQAISKNSKVGFQKEWKSIIENGYTIQYPDNWDLDKSGQNGTSFLILSKLTSTGDKFRENVNLLIQDLSGKNITLDKYVEISEGQVKSMIKNGKILESKRLNSNKHEFHKMIYTGEQGMYSFKFEQYYWIKDNKVYILTFTCELNQFDSFKETGERILNSFKFK